MAASRPWLRPLAMRLHRWVALVLGAWFALLGLSGALLVWHAEIDRNLNPHWFAPRAACRTAETPVATSLAVFVHAAPGAQPAQVMAPALPGAAHIVWQKPAADGVRWQHFIDASCGRYLGRRAWGAARMDRQHIVPALYELHRALLSGEAGHVAVGLAGLLLLAVAITGALTAWPRHATREAWKRTLTVKRDASPHRRYYDLHRATGMWLLAFLLLMSITGLYLCFPKQGRALVAAALPTLPASLAEAQPVRDHPVAPDTLVKHAERLWPDTQWTRVQIPADGAGAYDVRLLQRGEPRMDTGDTRVRLSADNRVVDLRNPLHAPAGDAVLSWLFPLHSGEALGTIGRIAWTLFGLAPPLLFATGLWLWLKRRRQAGKSYANNAPRTQKNTSTRTA